LKKIDDFRHKGMRKNMVDNLRSRDIKNKNVLKAMLEVPRHFFLDSSFLQFAYEDNAFPIGFDQTISHPYTVAFQSELLDPKPGEKVLEIGTGSGYQSAILFKMGCNVYSIERFKGLYKKAKKDLNNLFYSVKLFHGDGYLGLPEEAPFDKIIVTAGALDIPRPLINQLSVGGTLVIPVGKESHIMTVLIKKSKDDFEIIEYNDFKFVPFLREKS